MFSPVDALATKFLRRVFETPAGRAASLAQLAEAEGEGEGRLFEALERFPDDDIRRLARRHGADERRHAAVLEARLAAQGVTPLRPAKGAVDFLDDELGLLSSPLERREQVLQAYAALHALERRMVSQYPVFARAMAPVDAETARALGRIHADEVRHVAYCEAAMAKLASSPEALRSAKRRARAGESAAFARYEHQTLRFLLANGLVRVPALVRWLLLAVTAIRVAFAPMPSPAPVPRPAGPRFTEPMPDFMKVLRRRVEAFFAVPGRSRFGGLPALAKSASFGLGAVVTWWLAVRGTGGVWGSWALALVHGACVFLFALSSAHDAAHGALVKSRRLNRVLQFCWDLAGASSWVTNSNHLRSHHVAPNVHGLDIAVGNEVLPLLRLHPEVPHRWWHRAQHVYFPLAYALSTLHKWFILDFVELANDSLGTRRGQRREVVRLLAFKLFVFGWAVVVPLVLAPFAWWQVALALVTLHLIPGLLIALTFQVTHVCEGNAFPSVRGDGRIEGSRAAHDFAVNSDLVPESRLLNWLSCGISIHLTHHLFPEVAHRWLPDVARIVEATAVEFGVPYRKHASVGAALGAHVRWLRAMSRPG